MSLLVSVLPIRFAVAITLGALLVSGCSSSDDDGSSPANGEAAGMAGGNSFADEVGDAGAPGDMTGGAAGEGGTGSGISMPDTGSPDTAEPGAIGSNPVMADPEARNSTRVDFEITVPAYMSDALQLRLRWGDEDLAGTWIGDEFWTVSGDFPTDTRNPLLVEFSDRNGDLVLGSVERDFMTGTDAAESQTIAADEFDTSRWDRDGDGVSNIDELRTGTDPLVADAPDDVRIIDSFGFAAALDSTASTLEGAFVRLDLPAMFSEQVVDDRSPASKRVTDVDFDFSEDGNGTYASFSTFEIALDAGSTYELDATRSVEGASVEWKGTSNYREGSLAIHRIFEFTNTLDGRQLVQTGSAVVSEGSSGEALDYTIDFRYDVVLDLDSVDGDGNCRVLRGNIEQVRTAEGSSPNTSTASRESPDERWSVSGLEFADLRYPDPTEAETLNTSFHCASFIR